MVHRTMRKNRECCRHLGEAIRLGQPVSVRAMIHSSPAQLIFVSNADEAEVQEVSASMSCSFRHIDIVTHTGGPRRR
ncbi:MAG: hypothetical protein ACD_62C00356G0002 [uncultured bacterium]|nr:MAG: hypothetical protein ACD_62C00356G0002 [uncultured bacterium]